jgi:hypothetical protein
VRPYIGGTAVLALLLGGLAVTLTGSPAATGATPRTPQAAASAASSELEALHAGRYADAWEHLTPADQAAIPLARWTSYYGQCGEHLASYTVLGAELADPATAIAVAQITYAGPGMPPVPGAIKMVLAYGSTGWRYDAPLGIWQQGSAARMLRDAQAEGIC